MNIEQRDIYTVPYPYTDLSGRKKRPVLVLSNGEETSDYDDYICVMVTSKDNKSYEDVRVEITNHIENGDLDKTSWAIPDTLMTLKKNVFETKLGKLEVAKAKDIVSQTNAAIEIKES